ncbi:MAG TPA: alpha-ketoglutarate-dependent dioxygenase AlkB [Bryobacteraceae bacterium]|nr:alpha-ketoglutarate-dependent dioxygenase AlkB [Bryobacteraceae bacterium]
MSLPTGFVFLPEFLDVEEEERLVSFIRTLEFKSFQMHGVTARRRIAHFGWHYSFESFRVTEADPIPEAFLPVRARAAALAAVAPDEFAEALVTEYQPGAGIGWHRDAPPFGIVAGISMAGACRMRFQRGKGAEREVTAIELPPRSVYLLTGEARSRWEHTIPATKALRYSLTFRTMKRRAS